MQNKLTCKDSCGSPSSDLPFKALFKKEQMGHAHCCEITRPRHYKSFFMLNSTEHENPNHKC